MGKVGRPTVITDSWYKKLKALNVDVRTRRGHLNKHYETVAWVIIKDLDFNNKNFLFVIDKNNGEIVKFKSSIFEQLGRICEEFGEDTMIEVTKVICEDALSHNLTVKQWQKHLMNIRKKLRTI